MSVEPEKPLDDVDGEADPLAGSDAGSTELESPPATLVEIAPGMAVWLGEAPTKVELASLDLLPELNRKMLGDVLSAVGNTATIGGKLAEAVASAQGLYRLSGTTQSLLQGGAQLAIKDGANIGAVMLNGKVISQARFIPAGLTTASAIAALGPTVALLGLQLALGEVTSLAKTNLEYTKQVLETMSEERRTKLAGLENTIADAVKEARQVGTVTQSTWDRVSSREANINEQHDHYRQQVAAHLAGLADANVKDKRKYLERHVTEIVFDSHALLESLRVYSQYHTLRAAIALDRGRSDPNEMRVFEHITRETSLEVEERLGEIRKLILGLVRVLRINSELSGKAKLPLGKGQGDAEKVRLTCRQLLDAIAPLADLLQPPAEMPAPETRCAPESLDIEPYLKVLRWHLDGGEQMRGIAFACEGTCGSYSPIKPSRVDASWNVLTASGLGSKALAGLGDGPPGKSPDRTLVAVTNRRIITADPEELLKKGELRDSHPLETVRYVRPRGAGLGEERPTIGVTTERIHYEWMFPEEADVSTIDAMVAAINADEPGRALPRGTEGSTAIE